jgi:predicted HTH domain antitoxin
LEAAIQLFKDETVTLGRAAELAGLTRWEFETIVTDRGIERVVTCDAAANLERQVKALGE